MTRKYVIKYLKNQGFGKQRMEVLIGDECKALIKLIHENINKPMLANNLFGVSIMNVLWRLVAGRR